MISAAGKREAGRSGGRRLLQPGGALAVFATTLVLTLAMAAPVLVAPSTRLFGEEIAGRHHDPYTVVQQFENPRGLGLYTQPATDWIGAAAARLLGGGVEAYNFMALVSFPLAALFAFLLGRRLTGSIAAAWTAALIYAFLPFHLAHAAYHPHGAQTQWLPLYFLALWLSGERLSTARAALLALAGSLVALSSFYYGLIALVLTPVALAGQWGLAVAGKREHPHRAPLATLGFLAALAAAGFAYVARWAPAVLENPGALAFSSSEVERYTARWWSYLMPPVGHPLGGRSLAEFWARQDVGALVELQTSLGIGVLALALVAVFAWFRGHRCGPEQTVPALSLFGAAAFVASMPPVWRLGPLALPAPSGLLHELAPMFRAHARFALAAGLAAALLAGIGLQFLWRRPRAGRAAGCALALLALVELAPFPPWRWRDVLPTTAHRWLAERDEPSKVLDCVDPLDRGEASLAWLYPKPLSRLPSMTDCGDPQAIAGFAAQGFSHLLVRRDSAFGRWLSGNPTPNGLSPIGDFADALLFRVAGEGPGDGDRSPGALSARYTAGFYEREYTEDSSYRWMMATGRLELTLAAADSLPVAIDLRLHAFPAPREIDVLLDGRALTRLTVGTEPAISRLELGDFVPGRHRLELVAVEPASVPNDLLANGDRRPLTVALWDWRWRAGPT